MTTPPFSAPILSDPLTEVSRLEPACWPLSVRPAGVAVMVERVTELLCSLCRLLPGVLLLVTFPHRHTVGGRGFNGLHGIGYARVCVGASAR